MGEIEIEYFILEWLLQDKDFQDYPFRVFLDKDTGDFLQIYDDEQDAHSAGLPEGENSRNRERVQGSRNRFLELPIPDHGQYHQWFQEWLDEIGEGYFGSIGGWFKEFGNQGHKHMWNEFKARKVFEYVKEIAKNAGLTLKAKY